MVSQYCAIAVLFGVFSWLNYLKYRRGDVKYSLGEILTMYAVTRFGGVLSLATRSAQNLLGLVCDLAIFVLFYLLMQGEEKKKRAAALYIMNPLPLLAVLTGQIGITVGVAVAVLWIFLLRWLLGGAITKKEWLSLYPSFMLLSAAIGLYLFGSLERGETLSSAVAEDGVFPVCSIIGLAALVAGLLWFAVRLIAIVRGNREKDVETAKWQPEPACETLSEKPKMTKKDFLLMGLLTVMAGLLIFFRLGAFYAPETTMELLAADGTNEIILDFGTEIEIAELDIFLGAKEERQITLSKYDADTGEWVIIGEDNREVKSVFCWNEIEVNEKVRYLGVVSTQEIAYFNEFVVIDGDNNHIVPANASDYPLLFDEPEKFPSSATYYYRTMFDEIYHGRTAYELVHELPIYEISHPPLGKILMSIGVSLFGMTPFGWRCICALFGTMMVPLIYLFAWRLSKKTMYAVISAALLSLDFMHLTLSRIATIDIIIAFFIILMFYLMYEFLSCWRENLPITEGNGDPAERKKCIRKELIWAFLCGTATGLAIATKWTGLYAAAGLVLMLIVFMIDIYGHAPHKPHRGKHLRILFLGCLASFIVMPLVIYVLSYLPYTKVEENAGLLETVIENGKYMLSYHEATIFEHPYASEWYEWPWVGQPLLDAITYVGDEKVSSVATLGNPAIWLSGLAALLHLCYLWRVENDKKARFLVLGYVAVLAPWLFVHRTVFIYQYFCCAILLTVMLGYSLSKLKKHRKIYSVTLLSLSALLFILFYSELTGLAVPKDYVNMILEWLPQWTFA